MPGGLLAEPQSWPVKKPLLHARRLKQKRAGTVARWMWQETKPLNQIQVKSSPKSIETGKIALSHAVLQVAGLAGKRVPFCGP